MTRRRWMWTIPALGACRRAEPAAVFPENAVGWKRTALRRDPPSEAPEAARRGVRGVITAVYEGKGKVEARAYEAASSAVALDMAQRWPPAPGEVFFYRGRYFVVVRWSQADRAALQSLVRELERNLPPG